MLREFLITICQNVFCLMPCWLITLHAVHDIGGWTRLIDIIWQPVMQEIGSGLLQIADVGKRRLWTSEFPPTSNSLCHLRSVFSFFRHLSYMKRHDRVARRCLPVPMQRGSRHLGHRMCQLSGHPRFGWLDSSPVSRGTVSLCFVSILA